MAFIELKDIRKEYSLGDTKIIALDKCSFGIEKGELAVILGPSGAGKTTVLNILGGMDDCDSGKIIVDGSRIDKFNSKFLTKYRREDIGFVFQFYNLIQNLTAIENVELACQICQNALEPKKIISQVGLEQRMMNFPSQLSGGEQQRVAIARAIAKNPKLLLCDEPTGALDSNTGKKIIELLHKNCRDMKMTTVIITHNSVIAEIADKVIKMRNGKVEEVIVHKHPKNINEIAW